MAGNDVVGRTTGGGSTGGAAGRNTIDGEYGNRQDDLNDSGGGGGYGYGGGGGGGGYGSSSPTDEQKDAAKSLEAITAFNAGTLAGKGKAGMDALDVANKNALRNRDLQIANNKKTAVTDWFAQQQKEQSTLKQLREKMGNAYYGSGALNLADDLAKVDDMADVEIIRALEDNNDAAYQNYYEAILENINSRNELAMNTEASLRELFGDYAAQLNNISPKLASGEEGDNGNVIDRDARAINVPDWFQKYLNENSYDALKRGALDFRARPLTRSLADIQLAQSNRGASSSTGDANPDYSALSYERRDR